jgi:hypothetical protein
MRFQVNSYAKS